MPPKDLPTTSHLVALGTAAVLAVYGAGFVRTQAAAARFEGDKPRRRPPAPVTVPQHSADVSTSPAATAEVITKVAPAAGQAPKVKAERQRNTSPIETASGMARSLRNDGYDADIIMQRDDALAAGDAVMVLSSAFRSEHNAGFASIIRKHAFRLKGQRPITFRGWDRLTM